jgi:hypothetical protein
MSAEFNWEAELEKLQPADASTEANQDAVPTAIQESDVTSTVQPSARSSFQPNEAVQLTAQDALQDLIRIEGNEEPSANQVESESPPLNKVKVLLVVGALIALVWYLLPSGSESIPTSVTPSQVAPTTAQTGSVPVQVEPSPSGESIPKLETPGTSAGVDLSGGMGASPQSQASLAAEIRSDTALLPSAEQTCSSALLHPDEKSICVTQGPIRFYQCTGNGKRWDVSRPGCDVM